MKKLFVIWTPHAKGNQVIVETTTLVFAIQEAIHQVGFFAKDWTGYELDCINPKWHQKIIADSMILIPELS